MIHDLTHPEDSNVNAHVESPYFQLPTAVDFAKRLSRGAFIWKGDVDKAFRNVPVRKRDWPLLAFHVDGVLYVDTRLSFGHALSPFYFVNMVGRPLLYVAVRRGASTSSLTLTISLEAATLTRLHWSKCSCGSRCVQTSVFLCRKPRPFCQPKWWKSSASSLTRCTCPLASTRFASKILDEMSHVEGRKAVKKKELERLAGKVFVCSVVPGGRTFMREILDTLNRLRSRSHWAYLTGGFRADLLWWKRFAQAWNGVEPIPPPVTIPWRWLTSDASGDHGIGVFCCGAALHVPLPVSIQTQG